MPTKCFLLVHRLKTPQEERTAMTKTCHASQFLEVDGAFVFFDADVMNGDDETTVATRPTHEARRD